MNLGIAFIKCVFATVCLLGILLYDFVTLCRIIDKGELVKKLITEILPRVQYDEKMFMLIIRPILLQVSFVAYLISYDVLYSGGLLTSIFRLALVAAPVLSLFNIIKK